MATEKPKPWFKVFHADDLSNSGLRFVSLSAVAVWHMARCLIYQAAALGRMLTPAGAPITVAAFAAFLGRPVAEIEAATNELLTAGLLQLDVNGALLCPRAAASLAESKTKGMAANERWNRYSDSKTNGAYAEKSKPCNADSAYEYASASSHKGGVGENSGNPPRATWNAMADRFGDAPKANGFTDPNQADPEIDALVSEWCKAMATSSQTAGVAGMDAHRYAEPGSYGRTNVMEALRWGIAERKPWRSVMGRARSLAETAGWVKPETKPKNPSKVQGDVSRFRAITERTQGRAPDG